MTEVLLMQTKNERGEVIYRVVVNGVAHPVDFINRQMALSQMGLLRSQGYKEGRHDHI